MRFRLFARALALAASLLTPLSAVAAPYTLIDSGTYILGAKINNSGQICGQGFLSGRNYYPAVVYSNGRLFDLNRLLTPDDQSAWILMQATDINESGQMVGYGYHNNGLTYFFWSNGTIQDLGVPEDPPAYGDYLYLYVSSGATGVVLNDNRQIAGSYSVTDAINAAPKILGSFLDSSGIITDLGLPTTGRQQVNGINAAGQVVGLATFAASSQAHGFVSAHGALTDLGTLGGAYSEANAINNSGQIVGAADEARSRRAFQYSDGVMRELGGFSLFDSVAQGINNNGQIVGGSQTFYGGDKSPFIYSGGRMIDLNSLLSQDDKQNWTLESAEGINDNGQIVGRAVHGNIRTTFILTPGPLSPAFDFDGDGHADLLFQSQSTGAVAYVTLNGLAPVASDYLFRSVPGDYKVVAAPNISGNATPDLLFQSQSTGKVAYTGMHGLAPDGHYGFLFDVAPANDSQLNTGEINFYINPPPGFQVVGAPELTGAGNPHLLLQNQSTGDVAYAIFSGLRYDASGYLFRGVDPNLKIVGTPDLNGDGHPDILFQNMKTGDVDYALMDGLTPLGYGVLFSSVSLEYNIVGTPDLNGDGHPDIVFQGQTNGNVVYALMDGLNATRFGYLLRGVNLDFKIVGIH